MWLRDGTWLPPDPDCSPGSQPVSSTAGVSSQERGDTTPRCNTAGPRRDLTPQGKRRKVAPAAAAEYDRGGVGLPRGVDSGLEAQAARAGIPPADLAQLLENDRISATFAISAISAISVDPDSYWPRHPQHPQRPRQPQHPQHPQYSQHPQYPQYPQYPQHPQRLHQPQHSQQPQHAHYPQHQYAEHLAEHPQYHAAMAPPMSQHRAAMPVAASPFEARQQQAQRWGVPCCSTSRERCHVQIDSVQLLDAWVGAKRVHSFEAADRIRLQLLAHGVDPNVHRPRDWAGWKMEAGRVRQAVDRVHDAQAEEWLDQWVEAKRNKDFALADRIREDLRQQKGVQADKARPCFLKWGKPVTTSKIERLPARHPDRQDESNMEDRRRRGIRDYQPELDDRPAAHQLLTRGSGAY